MFQIKTQLIDNKIIRDKYLRLAIQTAKVAKHAKPGQFVEIKVSDGFKPLLRRPISIHRVKGSRIEILYEVVGKGTELLSQKKAGEYLDIIGPLGNGFDYQSHVTSRTSQVLVAGGIGVAPLLFLAEKLRSKNTVVLIGAKTKDQILCKNDFKKLGCDVRISTDDGSEGFRGKVTDLLKGLLRTKSQEPRAAIYACGPELMLKEIRQISKSYDIPAQVSLEAHMACGFGACLGCAVDTQAGYKLVCKDGPVFNAEEILW